MAATTTTTTGITLAYLHSQTRGALMALGAQYGLAVRDTLPKAVIVDRLAQHLVPGHAAGSVVTSTAGAPNPLASSLNTKAKAIATGQVWAPKAPRATTTTAPAATPPPAPAPQPTAPLLAAINAGRIGSATPQAPQAAPQRPVAASWLRGRS